MLQTFIRAFDNKNSPILAGNKPVERVYFNLLRLVPGETHRYRLSEYESDVVPMSGTCDLAVDGESFSNLGRRPTIWDGKADAVYAGPNADVAIVAQSGCEIAIAGGVSRI
jgi:5-deoxy-glucuronate isomerase